MDVKMLWFLGFTVVVTVICLAIGVKVIAQFQTQSYDTVGHDVVNETKTGLATVPATITLTNIPVVSGSETLVHWNVTSGTAFGTLVKGTNYTVTSYTLGTFSVTDLANKNTSASRINATYQYTTQDSNAITDVLANGLTGMTSISDWIPIIILVIIGAFVIMFLVKTFMPLGLGSSSSGE